MKMLLLKFALLVIVLLSFGLESAPQNTQADSVLISIDRLRVANLLFAERDYYEEAYFNCKEIASIQVNTIRTQDSIYAQLESKITNLEFIIDAKDDIISIEKDKAEAIEAKYKKERKFIIGGGGALLVLLLLL